MYIRRFGMYIPHLGTGIPSLQTEPSAISSMGAAATAVADVMATAALSPTLPQAVIATAVFLLANHFAMLFFLTKFAL